MFWWCFQTGLEDLNSELSSERIALLQEKGKQNRLATSVTEQINQEAQVSTQVVSAYTNGPRETEKMIL